MQANLTEAHVVALRLYTSAAYISLNSPLRDLNRTEPHPFAVTVAFINEAIKRLRAVGAATAGAQSAVTLWRGMRNLKATSTFLKAGGTEVRARHTLRGNEVVMRW